MAQLGLALGGAAIGSMFGMPGIGFSIGAALGGYLTQPKAPDGPRINDRKLQDGQYGQMIPIVYGRERLAGTVIDQTELTEHAHHHSGKGQSGPTEYTYTASYDVAICEGPIAGVLRIWADGRLVYDLTGSADVDNTKLPITVYLGTEDQAIDPTFEAVHGVGNVSAYLGTAHVVFTDHELADFYNRIPNYEFEVFTAGGDIPWRVSTFDAKLVDTNGGTSLGGTLDNGVITIGQYYNATPPHRYTEYQYTVFGDPVGSVIDFALPNLNGLPAHVVGQVSNKRIAFCYTIPGSGNVDTGWYVNGVLATVVSVDGGTQYTPAGTPLFAYLAAQGLSLFQNGFIYAIAAAYPAGNGSLARWPCDGDIPRSTADLVWTPPYSILYTDIKIFSSDNGRIYVGNASASSISTDIILWELTEELEVSNSWLKSEIPTDAQPASFSGQALIYNGIYAAPGGLIDSETYAAWDLASWTALGDIPIDNTHLNNRLGGGLVLGIDGVYSLDPLPNKIPLYAIVNDLCSRGDLDIAQYDTSELQDLVTGFKLTRQGSLRSAIETLIPAYAFSGVERDTLIAFPKRGHTPTITIPAADLAATEYGSDQPAVRDYNHGHGDHLPRQVTVVYEEETADYQPGAQVAQRTVGDASSPQGLEFAIAMTAPEARAIAERMLLQAHVERDSFNGSTARKYLYLEPTDNIVLVDRTVMLTEKEHTPSGLVTWKAAACVPQIYTGTNTGTITGSAGSGFQQPVAVPRQLTELILLDIASGTPFGFTAAMGKTSATGGSWPGATLYKSIDGGINWVNIASTSIPDTIGAATDVLASFAGPIDDVTIDDVSTVTIQLTDTSLQLSSVTITALTNGANICALRSGAGWEILQFMDATLVAPGQYTLTNFFRARRDTAAFMATHAVGDTFVLLPAISVDAPEHELNIPLLYKAVTSGMTLAETPQQTFTNTGASSDDYFQQVAEHLPEFDGTVGGTVPVPATGDCAAGKFLSACGTWQIPAGTGGGALQIDVYSTPGTTSWTKHTGATAVHIIVVGAGGGGGSGSASNTSNGGGAAGGGAGAKREMLLQASALSASETVVVGTGGSGGAAVTTTLIGNDGTAGGNSSFASVTAGGGGGGGSGGNATHYGGGGGGVYSAGGTAASGNSWQATAGAGGGAATSSSSASNEKACGGAPGAQSNTSGNGLAGYYATEGAMGGAAGGAGNTNGSGGAAYNQYGALSIAGGTAGNVGGTASGIALTLQGAGGGGGGGKTSGGAAPGAGGAGQQPGGGGGGGGGTNINSQASGAGGVGGAGIVVVIQI